MGILRTNKISGLGTDGTVFQGVTRFDTQGYFVAPSGTTDQRNAGITTTDGTIRFNTDSQKLEFYAQSQWWEMVIDTPNLAVGSNTDAGARGVVAGSGPDGLGASNVIQYINILSTGNSIDFGDLITGRRQLGSLGSSTRGIFAGGYTPTLLNSIEFITISSTGNAQSFGNLTQTRRCNNHGLSNSTRGIFHGGYTTAPTAAVNTIDYITIASTGNAVDFGDLITSRERGASCSSSTRGIVAGGVTSSTTNTIDFITISTLGNSFDFGDLTTQQFFAGGCSSPTRGLFGGGDNPTKTNIIDFITISTIGNASSFGNLTVARDGVSACSSSTRGTWHGGRAPGAGSNIIDYAIISTQGNAVDFGDLYFGTDMQTACSNAHGGL